MSVIPLRVLLPTAIPSRQWRFYTTSNALDLRVRLMNEVKTAMKDKDTVTSTTLRSVLSEVYAADKASNDKVPSSTIANILRKAVIRRDDAAAKFSQASRPELAEKELQEKEILSKFLPPLLSEAEIDQVLGQVIGALPAELNPQKSLGRIFKEFYSKIDKSSVDTALVKQRADALLAKSS
ncbi:Altered inheritance of mitochondria protein 41, mitochondrial [Hypsizygus marmoreus]|uniref:Altered inheritance of mitochondria protein 41 n=1 Tax=Hypsizygus marmoreus TaxID=39966 RepID=A0A369JSR7_HYPMA|nr:Altered inheritance of mitochondria protein 41, mitochondrial [Hypsizygus marmoreus]